MTCWICGASAYAIEWHVRRHEDQRDAIEACWPVAYALGVVAGIGLAERRALLAAGVTPARGRRPRNLRLDLGTG